MPAGTVVGTEPWRGRNRGGNGTVVGQEPWRGQNHGGAGSMIGVSWATFPGCPMSSLCPDSGLSRQNGQQTRTQPERGPGARAPANCQSLLGCFSIQKSEK